MTAHEIAIVPKGLSFSHADATRVFDLALRYPAARMILIDLKNVQDATTAAFARLVLLRRRLLDAGRDLRLTGLHDRAADVYKLNRLMSVLPTREQDSAARLAPAPPRDAARAAVRVIAAPKSSLRRTMARCVQPMRCAAAAFAL